MAPRRMLKVLREYDDLSKRECEAWHEYLNALDKEAEEEEDAAKMPGSSEKDSPVGLLLAEKAAKAKKEAWEKAHTEMWDYVNKRGAFVFFFCEAFCEFWDYLGGNTSKVPEKRA